MVKNEEQLVPTYWLAVTGPESFKIDRQNNFAIQGFTSRLRVSVGRVKPGDKIVVYINRIQKIGAICEATSEAYYDDKNKIWLEDDEIWPCRFKTCPELVLDDDELLDIRKLVSFLSFVTPEQRASNWGLAFRYSLRIIPQEDFKFIESEMRKIRRVSAPPEDILTEAKATQAIMEITVLESKSLHDRIGEMLETIGSRMGYNSFTRHRVTPEHAVELDVAWLQGKNPEVAIEIQIGGNIVEAKDKLAQAKKFNYRKVIMVVEESQLPRLNAIVKFDEIIDWMDAWSIQAVYKLYTSGISFLDLYERLRESRYKKKTEVELVKA